MLDEKERGMDLCDLPGGRDDGSRRGRMANEEWRRGEVSRGAKASCCAAYQLNLSRIWIWRGKLFWVEAALGNRVPKLGLLESVLKRSRP